MKIMHEQVDLPGGSPIKVKWDDFPCFTFPWHYHSEYEIVYVLKSYGKRYVGDSIDRFDAGDLVLLGSNLPHFWKNDEAFYADDSSLRVNALVVQFPAAFLTHELQQYPEFRNIKGLLSRAERGIRFTGTEGIKIGEQLLDLQKLSGLDRFLAFLNILGKMSIAKHAKLLATEAFKTKMPEGTDDRLVKILNYVQLNYQSDISIEELASKFGMNTTAFCRYFKEKTSKTTIQYINELRVGYACKLLIDKRMSVMQVCYECGFGNVANFNRIFKRITAQSPTDYRKQLADSSGQTHLK